MTHTEAEVLAAIRSLEVVSSHPAVAIKLVEISRDPAAGIEDYASLIETDPGLTSRLLGLVNSAWFAPSSAIETVHRAVCSLGLSQLRTVALAHCVASLHKSLGLEPEDARAIWAGSMCKAIGARTSIEHTRPEQAVHAFTMALLQDLGYAVLHSIDPEAMGQIYRQGNISPTEALNAERELFGTDHCQIIRPLGTKLSLPELYVQEAELHHQEIEVEELVTLSPLALAGHVASLFPHDVRHWAPSAAEELGRVVDSSSLARGNVEELVEEIQTEFAELDEQLNDTGQQAPDLLGCLLYASEETARSTAVLVGQNSYLTQDAAALQQAVVAAERAKEEAELRADQDPLTRLLNRRGWDRRAFALVRQADSSGRSVGVAFFDLDAFKEVNDEHGHASGDAFLVEIGRRIQDSVRAEDLVCRWGGDEFVILFQGIDCRDCREAVERVKRNVESTPVTVDTHEISVSVSAGFVTVEPSDASFDLKVLLKTADELLYEAKKTERGTLVSAG